MDEEEEEDYLSDALLARLDEQSKNTKSTSGRVHALFEPATRNKRSDAQIVLAEGLSKPIPESNVGFKLLTKMGFNKDDSTKTEPIEVNLKKTRAGLGVEEASRKHARQTWSDELAKMENDVKLEKERKTEYLKSRGEEFEMRKHKAQLAKIRQIETTLREKLSLAAEEPAATSTDLVELDGEMVRTSIDVTEDEEDKPSHDGEDAFVEPDYTSILHDKVMELRQAPFFYCFYCGHRYADQTDLIAGCPGEREQDHD